MTMELPDEITDITPFFAGEIKQVLQPAKKNIPRGIPSKKPSHPRSYPSKKQSGFDQGPGVGTDRPKK